MKAHKNDGKMINPMSRTTKYALDREKENMSPTIVKKKLKRLKMSSC